MRGFLLSWVVDGRHNVVPDEYGISNESNSSDESFLFQWMLLFSI